MCFFPKNVPYFSPALKYGITEFECGVCPECLSKRSRKWALRCAYEAKTSPSMMICLTYDGYIYDSHHRIIGERVSSDMQVNKRDCQLFMKRLRKAYPDLRIKYLLSAEYGKRTHRPHYHALIFGLQFDDLRFYKKSKRGNPIYKSATLDRIWGNGICTVDAVNVRSACARYCTKYAMKDKGCDTFMLFSRDIGHEGLMKDFNGISYHIDGNEYPIPKRVWQDVICKRYNLQKPCYRNIIWCQRKYPLLICYYYGKGSPRHWFEGYDVYRKFCITRKRYSRFRDNDEQYQRYIAYWKEKAEKNPKSKLSVIERINLLDDKKYFSYKQEAKVALNRRSLGLPIVVPRSNNLKEYYLVKEAILPQRKYYDFNPFREKARSFSLLRERYREDTQHLSLNPCPLTTNDTALYQDKAFFDFLSYNLDTGEIYDSTILHYFENNTSF